MTLLKRVNTNILTGEGWSYDRGTYETIEWKKESKAVRRKKVMRIIGQGMLRGGAVGGSEKRCRMNRSQAYL